MPHSSNKLVKCKLSGRGEIKFQGTIIIITIPFNIAIFCSRKGFHQLPTGRSSRIFILDRDKDIYTCNAIDHYHVSLHSIQNIIYVAYALMCVHMYNIMYACMRLIGVVCCMCVCRKSWFQFALTQFFIFKTMSFLC